jgi:hypothetical protein
LNGHHLHQVRITLRKTPSDSTAYRPANRFENDIYCDDQHDRGVLFEIPNFNGADSSKMESSM